MARIRGASLALAFGAWLAAGPPAGGQEVSWSVHDRQCALAVTAALRVPCGSYGVLGFAVTDDGGCTAAAQGSETPRPYPHPAGGVAGGLAPRRDAFPTWGGGPPQGGVVQGPLESLPAPPPPWVAVIDWADAHGESVMGLIELLAAGAAAATLYALDGPDLAPLGEPVGDAHVLARLCAVAEEAEVVRGRSPLTLNLSFGRLPQEGDPASAASCDASRLACQIAKLLAHLRGLGTVPVAAAGNHQSLLFPAAVAEALAAAPLDVSWFLASQLAAAVWQAPAAVDVVLPGHAVCVEGAVVPAGSSYASAFFSGWYAFVAAAQPPLEPFGGVWSPAWSAAHGCYVLGQAGELYGPCNPGLGPAVAGIVLGSASGCWEEPGASGKPVVVVPGPGAPVAKPPAPSFDHWASRQQHPAPESDPCIPCVGGGASTALASAPEAAPDDLLLNLSSSAVLPSEAHLERVYFRLEEAFYPLDLSPADLDALTRGEVGGLLLEGFGSLLPALKQPSLFYLVSADPAVSCTAHPAEPACFWTSTPIFVP
jgi:hypothetical protein